jgi:outer membrane protein OmpA-like peptidoglycan-associated protein
MSRQKLSASRITTVILAAFAIFSLVSSAQAQLRPWDATNQVMVDLSVLSDNGVGPAPAGGAVMLPSLTGDLLDPPARSPRSRLLVKRPPAGAAGTVQDLPKVTLKRPGKSTKKRRNASRKSTKPRSRAPKVAALNAPPPKPSVKTSKPARNLAPAPKARPKPPVVANPAPPPVVAKAAPPPPPKVKAPAPTVKKAPAAKPKQTQTASLPSAAPAGTNQLIFAQGATKLNPAAQKSLDALAAKLNAQPQSRMQLLAYAGEGNLSASKARRLSLSRALSVRSYLIKKGVRSTRIDVRALGNKVPSGVPNRVDLKIVGK